MDRSPPELILPDLYCRPGSFEIRDSLQKINELELSKWLIILEASRSFILKTGHRLLVFLRPERTSAEATGGEFSSSLFLGPSLPLIN